MQIAIAYISTSEWSARPLRRVAPRAALALSSSRGLQLKDFVFSNLLKTLYFINDLINAS